MPYRIDGKTVKVKTSDGWRVIKTHPTAEKAVKHLRALYANAKPDHRKKPR